MYGSEVPVFIFCCIASLVAWLRWISCIVTRAKLARSRMGRGALLFAPAACAAVLLGVLLRWASSDVVDSPPYLLFYCMMGAAWVGILRYLFVYLGISWLDDAAERGNPAAMLAATAALLGLTLAFAGGNIGDGPGWWVVVFASGMATIAWFAAWFVLEIVARPSEGVTVDRDIDCALRLAGFLVAAGIVCGRGAAGDWVSPAATLRDFVPYAAGTAALTALATGIETMLRSSTGARFRNVLLCGLVPAIAYVAAAAVYISRKGWW